MWPLKSYIFVSEKQRIGGRLELQEFEAMGLKLDWRRIPHSRHLKFQVWYFKL